MDTTALARQLDALTLAGQDNMARALREVATIQAFAQTERIVQGHLVELQTELARSDQMKRETAALLSGHRFNRPARITGPALTQAIEYYREGIAK